MGLPKPRNLIVGILVGAGVVAFGLVIAQDQETVRVRTSLSSEDPRFPAYLSRLLGDPLSEGDRYIVHTNGDAAFPAMLAAINGAKSRVAFESYIFESGTTGGQFVAAFEAAATRGVEVRIVIDGLGAKKVEQRDLERLEKAGCKIGWFNQVGDYSKFEEVNYRTHRKELVVDGDVAFVGGMGVADQWAFDVKDAKQWRDTMVEVRGPAAVNIEAAFNENWIETGGIVEPDILTHPASPKGPTHSIVVWSSPTGGTNGLKLLYLMAIASARKTIDIQSPYFVTDESTMWSLRDARRRGVRIRVLTEGDVTDAKPVKFASRAQYETLLQLGIEIYEYQPAMMHTKALMVDGVLSIVGSANFDNRSLELNDEINVAVFDRDVAGRLAADFERDRKNSTRLDLDDWRSRPVHIRGREKGWALFGEVF